MVSLKSFAHLADIDLGERAPKKSAISGEPAEAEQLLWKSSDGKVEVGVWECTPGRFAGFREDNSEVCHIVSGSATLRGLGGSEQNIGPGEMVVLPIGWRGEWTVHETIRKLYVVHFENVSI